jgi:hypothetical protein
MQAPHPPQKKTAQTNKVWEKQTLKTNWATNGFFGGSQKILGSP